MSSLGELGVRHAPAPTIEEDPDTFEWFGVNMRTTTDVDEVELIEVMATFRATQSIGVAALGGIKEGLQMLVHPDDFDQFWGLARQNKQTTEDLMKTFQALLFRTTDRPTQQPSDSSPGRLPTDVNSQAALPSPASSGPEQPARPDIQAIHDDMNEFRLRKAAALAV